MKANMYYIQIFESDSIFLGLAYLLLGVIHKLREQVRGEGGVSKMFTFLYTPYRVKWFTRGEGALLTIFTILLTLWNSEQKNGLLIKLFCFLSNFDETW